MNVEYCLVCCNDYLFIGESFQPLPLGVATADHAPFLMQPSYLTEQYWVEGTTATT